MNEDSTITFHYCGTGRRVVLEGDFLYSDQKSSQYSALSKSIRMRRDSDGCFQTTIRPLSPEMYTYCFRVDGKHTADPMSNDTAWQEENKWNILTVGGGRLGDIYSQPTRTGQVYQTRWYSSTEQVNRRVYIYTPAAYDTCTTPMDVLYLIHGINGYEGSWTERGRAIQIMENMVRKGYCRPMVIVMPDNNVDPDEDCSSHRTIVNSMMLYGKLCRDSRIEYAIGELMDMIDTTYRVSGRCAVAGLSNGARIAANLAKDHPDRVYAVGMFSPVIKKEQLPTDSMLTHCQRLAPCISYSVYVGKKDWMFYCNGKRFHKQLDKAQVRHEYLELGGGHDWRFWREALVCFMEQLGKVNR